MNPIDAMRLIKKAFNLPSNPQHMSLVQKDTYKAMKKRYAKSNAVQRETMLANARAMIADSSTT